MTVSTRPAPGSPSSLSTGHSELSAQHSVLSPQSFWWLLAILVLAGLAYRLAVIFSPLGELDADEAVVGLMARHIAFLGDRPVFYYNQQYLGSLEAFTAAPLFFLFGSSSLLLKLVPTVYSLGFLVLTALTARRLFGEGPALITGAYVAIPPVFWAVWSTKARGGYAELVFLGAAVVFVTLWLADRPRPWWGALLLGLLAGLAFWTHLLAVVYLVPCAVYVLARRSLSWSLAEVAPALLGAVVGMLPMLVYNVASGFPTITALVKPPDLPFEPVSQFFRFFRIGIPVLLGLGQPTTSTDLFDHDWLHRPAGNPFIAGLALLGLFAAVGWHVPAVRRLFSSRPRQSTGPALLVLLAVVIPPVIAVTRFGFFVSEPRYALPLYSVIPLVAYALWRLPRRWCAAAVVALLGFNVYSLASTDIRLWRPEDSPNSTAANRAGLIELLQARGYRDVYTDYWIAYPLMFESRGEIDAYAVVNGFNRYIPPAYAVQHARDPVWVYVPDTEPERLFLEQLRRLGGTARAEDVDGYRVYENVTPLDRMRPPD